MSYYNCKYCKARCVEAGKDKEPPADRNCFRGNPGKPLTKYDRLISKSPEEMAELFEHLCCPYSLGGKVDCNAEQKGCQKCWLGWLKSPAEEASTNG